MADPEISLNDTENIQDLQDLPPAVKEIGSRLILFDFILKLKTEKKRRDSKSHYDDQTIENPELLLLNR
jgi:hypothetical protein